MTEVVDATAPLSPETLEQLLLQMWQIRCFETRAGELFDERPDPRAGALVRRHGGDRRRRVLDASARTTSSRARTAAMGTASRRASTSRRMMAEILGREDGYCRGKGGSMHITAIDTGMLGADAIVARLARRSRSARRTACGSRARTASSSASSATAPRTRASSTRRSTSPPCSTRRSCSSARTTSGRSRRRSRPSTRVDDIAVRAAGYGFPGVVVDGNDVLAVRDGRRRGRRPRARSARGRR